MLNFYVLLKKYTNPSWYFFLSLRKEKTIHRGRGYQLDKEIQMDEIQHLLKKQYLKGPNFMMDEQKRGINYFSGNSSVAFYELFGPSQVFRILICKLPSSLFISKYVGRQYLMLLIEEEDIMAGGVFNLKVDIREEFQRIFGGHLSGKGVKELIELWSNFVQIHYLQDLNTNNQDN